MAAGRKIFGCSVISLGLAAAGLGVAAHTNSCADLDGGPRFLASVDAYLYGDGSDNLYTHYRAMIAEQAMDSNLADYHIGALKRKEIAEDRLMHLLDVDYTNQTEKSRYSSRSGRIIDSLASLESEKSLEYLVGILYGKRFGSGERWRVSQALYKKHLAELKRRPHLLKKVTSCVTTGYFSGEDFDTGTTLINIVAEAGYRPAAGFLLAIVKNGYSSPSHAWDYPAHARMALSHFPSKLTVDILAEGGEKMLEKRAYWGAIQFADKALEVAQEIGLGGYGCMKAVPVLDTAKKRYFHETVEVLRKHGCPVDETSWRY